MSTLYDDALAKGIAARSKGDLLCAEGHFSEALQHAHGDAETFLAKVEQCLTYLFDYMLGFDGPIWDVTPEYVAAKEARTPIYMQVESYLEVPVDAARLYSKEYGPIDLSPSGIALRKARARSDAYADYPLDVKAKAEFAWALFFCATHDRVAASIAFGVALRYFSESCNWMTTDYTADLVQYQHHYTKSFLGLTSKKVQRGLLQDERRALIAYFRANKPLFLKGVWLVGYLNNYYEFGMKSVILPLPHLLVGLLSIPLEFAMRVVFAKRSNSFFDAVPARARA